jgi:transcriptional regulator with XRE-family HTH domain
MGRVVMTVDRRSLNVLLAALDLEQRELAELMGYRKGYVANVLNGCTKASASFRDALGAAVTELPLGSPERTTTLPAAPLSDLIRKRAARAPCKEQFYEDLGISPHGWNKREVVSEALVDRVCCALGVHPSSLYGHDYDVEESL